MKKRWRILCGGNLGMRFWNILVAPFVSGVYAGDPETLSLRAAFPSLDEWEREYGSVLRGAMNSRKKQPGPRPGLCSFRGGMGALLHALESELGMGWLQARAWRRLKSGEPSGFTVRFLKGISRNRFRCGPVRFGRSGLYRRDI